MYKTILTRALLLLSCTSIALVANGCGSGEDAPTDPAYYKGPMEPKSGSPAAGEGGSVN